MKIRKFKNFIPTRELEYQRRSQFVQSYHILRLSPAQSVGTLDGMKIQIRLNNLRPSLAL